VISFFVPGKIQGKARPKFRRRGAFVTTYTPDTTLSYENSVRHEAHKAMNGISPYDGAVRMVALMRCAMPSSWSKKKREQALEDLIYPTTKPDIDNAIKILADGMNGIVYLDDKQIVQVSARKIYTEGQPGVEVGIETL
jgi:Holliday junction resolvase RusA-like endonuclease